MATVIHAIWGRPSDPRPWPPPRLAHSPTQPTAPHHHHTTPWPRLRSTTPLGRGKKRWKSILSSTSVRPGRCSSPPPSPSCHFHSLPVLVFPLLHVNINLPAARIVALQCWEIATRVVILKSVLKRLCQDSTPCFSAGEEADWGKNGATFYRPQVEQSLKYIKTSLYRLFNHSHLHFIDINRYLFHYYIF